LGHVGATLAVARFMDNSQTLVEQQTFGGKTSRERTFAALRMTAEGSSQTLRCAQGDRHSLPMSMPCGNFL